MYANFSNKSFLTFRIGWWALRWFTEKENPPKYIWIAVPNPPLEKKKSVHRAYEICVSIFFQIELLLWPFLVDFGLEQQQPSHRHNHAISRMKGKREHYILFAIDNVSLVYLPATALWGTIVGTDPFWQTSCLTEPVSWLQPAFQISRMRGYTSTLSLYPQL